MSRRYLAASIVLVLVLAGCESMGENTKKGAGIGAVAGAAIGGIVGHQSGHGLEGALIGGATGATAGGLLGSQSDRAADADFLSVVDVAKMAREGTPDSVIISEIDRTRSRYNLNTETIQYLKDNNVSDRVVDHMLGTAE